MDDFERWRAERRRRDDTREAWRALRIVQRDASEGGWATWQLFALSAVLVLGGLAVWVFVLGGGQ